MIGVKVMGNIDAVQEKESLVYFWRVYHEDYDTLVKIGITTDWPNRKAQLLAYASSNKNTWPDWLELGIIQEHDVAGFIVGGREMEKYLHNLFKAHALGREWFRYEECGDLIDEILEERCICC
jgi:hypothetical protein